jgi:hypothetical protein
MRIKLYLIVNTIIMVTRLNLINCMIQTQHHKHTTFLRPALRPQIKRQDLPSLLGPLKIMCPRKSTTLNRLDSHSPFVAQGRRQNPYPKDHIMRIYFGNTIDKNN